MAPLKPMLGDLELQQVQEIETDGEHVQTRHEVPALEGDFLQGLGRRGTRIDVAGVLTGPESRDGVNALREQFRAAEPVPFVSDVATAVRVDEVLIEDLAAREIAGRTERFAYSLRLREYIEPPAVTEEDPPEVPPPPPPPPEDIGTLVVEVIVENDSSFDMNRVTVTARGPETRTLTGRDGNVWTEEGLPPGSYTVEAVTTDPEMSASETAEVLSGETTEVTLVLRSGARIAKAFVVHFRFDSAFIEPCLRPVLREVVAYAREHPQDKVLIVGHTDLAGSGDYNQSLSERRARSVFAYLTFGRAPDAALADWNVLRQSRPAGQLPSLRDTWGVFQYQHMLQDLGYYVGNIDEDHGPETDDAVRAFQADHELPITGQLDDATWPILNRAYLAQDSLAVEESRFLLNSGEGCNDGILKWLGCGEQDPVRNTEDAWRPNRRTEVLFVGAEELPCRVPQPVTFELPTPGVVNGQWCLGPGDPNRRCCFLTRDAESTGRWLVQPARPERVQVSGTIRFEDGTPVAHAKYALAAADGEYLHTDDAGAPDLAEKPRSPGAGRPIADRADDQGRFSYPQPTPVGFYFMELLELTRPQVARNGGEGPETARGNVVCLHFDGDTPAEGPVAQTRSSGIEQEGPPLPPADSAPPDQTAVVQQTTAPAGAVSPLIEPANPNVVVRRSYTDPGRQRIVLRTDRQFDRTGTLTRSGSTSVIRLFDAASGGNEITFDGQDNVFPGADLTTGVELFAESDTPSSLAGDYGLTLALTASAAPAAAPVGPDARAALTAVRLTLDIFEPRPETGANPDPLPQPPAAQPPAGTATDKWFGGRLLNLQNAASGEPRVELRVRQVEPSNFAGDLVLRQVEVNGNNIGATTDRGRLFDAETGGTAQGNEVTFNATTVGLLGRDFFFEGANLSANERDAGFQIGLDGGQADGDRVAFTVGVAASIEAAATLRAVVVPKPNTSPARQPLTLRTGVPFARNAILTRSGNTGAVRLFTSATGGAPVAFDASNQASFPGAQLAGNGLQLFAEAVTASADVDDYILTLSLAPGSPAAGLPAILEMTSVELTLDVCLSRTAPNVDPVPMSAVDKRATGRFVQVADASFTHERAKLIIRPPNPTDFICELRVAALDPRARLFIAEEPAEGQPAVTLPDETLSVLAQPDGFSYFAEATDHSAAARDIEVQLGIVGLENDGDRVPMTAARFDLAENDAAASPALRAVRFGLWDQAYDAAGNVRPDFIDNDRRRFHFRLNSPLRPANVRVDWKTVRSNRTTDDDAPASERLTLVENPAGSGRFVSPGVMLVSDNTDAAQATPAARGAAEHRLRRARIDGFMRAQIQLAAGQVHHLVMPVFDRATPFDTTSATNITPGSRVVTPAAMSGTATTGARWSIQTGSILTVDPGNATEEEITVSAATGTTFTADFNNAHNGSVAPFRIDGTTDERRRLRIRVVRYNNPADATYLSETNANITGQFVHARRRWRQVGLQVESLPTLDRQIPAGALNAAGRFPFVHPNGAEEQAVLADLLPITPDNTLTAVFLHIDPLAQINAYAAILQTNPVPLPAGGSATMDDRFFVFINTRLALDLETLAHEMHHVLFNRFDGAAARRFFTFNTTAPNLFGIPLPSVLVYRRIQTLHSANPNLDVNNDNTFNWHRRAKTTRFPVAGDFNPAATATTGNTFTEDF